MTRVPPLTPPVPMDLAPLLLAGLDAAGELVLMRGTNGQVIYVNTAFVSAFGGEASDWVGRWFSVAPPSTDKGQRRYEMLMRTRNGPLWIEWDERALPDDMGVISVGRDVTARHDRHANLEASQHAKSIFFAAVTHELRTPLAGALGVASLLQTTPLRPDQADYVRSIASSAEHALAMVDDILDLTRLEAGKLTLHPQPVSVIDLVRETIELAAPRAHDKDLDLGVVVHSGAPSVVRGDAARLKQILFNLLGNAVKFTQTGGVRIDITNAADGGDSARLLIAITDTGPGISERDQQSLFEQFERGAAERENAESGAGLGLAMVRRLADAMGGSVGVESQLGHGSKFWVNLALPVIEATVEQPLQGRKLAIASSRAIVRETLADQLKALGADVVRIDAASRLAAAAGRDLLIDWAWADQAGEHKPSRAWQIVRPSDKDMATQSPPAGIDGWLVTPVRRATLVEQLSGRPLSSEAAAGPASAPVLPADALTLDGLNVLIVEDDPVNALIARKTLERFGAQPTLVETGMAALQALDQTRFDVALLDQRMPGMDGREVARLARLNGHDLPLIALTANVSEDDRASCLEAGMDDFLSKPLDPDLLHDTLQRLCRTENRSNLA